MAPSLEFWLTFFGMLATGLIGYGILKAKVDTNREALAAFKVEVEKKFDEKKESMEKNHNVMWEKIDTFSNALNTISQLIVRVETKLDIYSKKDN